MRTVYLAEDEPLALEALAEMFKAHPQWRVIGQADNGARALEDCLRQPPDLLITDIRMPILDGLELVAELRHLAPFPQVIFLTAYDAHAVQAFRLAAVDYLLKPITDAEFTGSLKRVEEQLDLRRADEKMQAFGPQLERLIRDRKKHLQTLVIKSIGRVDFVRTADVIALASAGNYIEVITVEKTHMHRQTLQSLMDQLDPERFLRIHRSTAVARAHIVACERHDNGLALRLSNGSTHAVGHTFEADVRAHLERMAR